MSYYTFGWWKGGVALVNGFGNQAVHNTVRTAGAVVKRYICK